MGLYAGDPEKTGQARDVADYATYLVPGIIGESNVRAVPLADLE